MVEFLRRSTFKEYIKNESSADLIRVNHIEMKKNYLLLNVITLLKLYAGKILLYFIQ